MKRTYLGGGWPFPVRTDHTGSIALSENEQDVEEAIRTILGTAKGERVMRPEFGSTLNEYVYSSVDATTLNLMENAVESSLIEWEPRIDLESVSAAPDETNGRRLLIDIKYRVRSTNAVMNLVYPFYLKEG
jgi:phage baseplate assembly protein W